MDIQINNVMMNKKYIIGAVVVVLAIVVGFLWGKKGVVAPESSVDNNVVEQTATSSVETSGTKSPVVGGVVAPTKTAPAMTKDGAYIVSYTNRGFVPATLTIKTGKSVHFVNNSSKAMSIVTTTTLNQIQSELNQGKTVGQGGSYDFTFLTPGTWVYMNRNIQSDYGTIIVQ